MVSLLLSRVESCLPNFLRVKWGNFLKIGKMTTVHMSLIYKICFLYFECIMWHLILVQQNLAKDVLSLDSVLLAKRSVSAFIFKNVKVSK
jgi:hypothetical protein